MNQPFPPGHPGRRQPPAGPGFRPPAMPGTYLRDPSPRPHPGAGPGRPAPPRPLPPTPPIPGIPAPRPSVDGRIPGGPPRPVPPRPHGHPQQWPGPQGNAYGPGDTAPALPRPLPPPSPGAPRARRSKKWIGWVVALLVLAGLGGAGYWFIGRTAPAAAAVGDCVAERGTNDVAVVPCGDPAAAFRVVGRLEDRTMIDASLFACTPFPDATSSYWQGKQGVGELGLVLCLAPVT